MLMCYMIIRRIVWQPFETFYAWFLDDTASLSLRVECACQSARAIGPKERPHIVVNTHTLSITPLARGGQAAVTRMAGKENNNKDLNPVYMYNIVSFSYIIKQYNSAGFGRKNSNPSRGPPKCI